MGHSVYRPASQSYTQSPIWETCETLTKEAAWVPDAEDFIHTHVRTVRWDETDPQKATNYLLTAHGLKGLIRKPKAWIFNLSGFDATEPEMYQYSSYWLARDGLFRATRSSLPTKDGFSDTEEILEAFRKNAEFTIHNGLDVPTIEDTIEVGRILKVGRVNGVIPKISSGS